MKVTQEKLPASQVGLEIEITAEMSKQTYEKTLQEFTRQANIPGFRKGKVPRQVLIQRFGATRIKAAVVEDLVQTSLKKAVEQENIPAIGQFELRSSFDDLIEKYEPGAELSFTAAVDVPPEVVLGDYTGLDVKAEEIKYDPAKVDEVIEDYRKRNATLVPIEGRAAQQGDLARVDFKGRLAEAAEGEEEPAEIPGGSAEDFEIELLDDRFIPGFIDGMFGMNPGETKDVSATFPEGYPQPDLAGKAAVFTITLKELKERELPELDDDFAQEVSEFETLAELRTSLETRFQKEADEKTKANKQQALLDELAKRIEVELPETLVKQEVDYSVTQTAMRLSQQGMDVRKAFTSDLVNMLRQQARPDAIERLKRTLALGEIAKKESIKTEEAEVKAKLDEALEYYQGRDVDVEQLQQVVEEDLLKEKILTWVEEHSSIELVPEGTLAPVDEEDDLAADEAEAPADEEEEAAVEQAAADSTIDVVATEAVEVSAGVESAAEPEATETATDEPEVKPAAKKGKKSAKSTSASNDE